MRGGGAGVVVGEVGVQWGQVREDGGVGWHAGGFDVDVEVESLR